MSLPYTPVVPQAELHQTQAALAASHAAHQELLGAHHEVTTQQKSAMANHSSTRDELLYRISALERQVWTPLNFWAMSRGIQCRTGWVIWCLLRPQPCNADGAARRPPSFFHSGMRMRVQTSEMTKELTTARADLRRCAHTYERTGGGSAFTRICGGHSAAVQV